MLDAIVVGGGVAGSYIASRIKGNVLMIERSRNILPKDSGIVSTTFNAMFGVNTEKLVKCEIDRMECVSPSGVTFQLKSDKPYAYILKREKFARFLRDMAGKNAEIRYENVTGVKFGSDGAVVETDSGEHSAKMVIGCDGANSVVRNAMGVEKPKCALGMMVKTKEILDGVSIRVFFNKYYSPDFFGWTIPQNNEYGLMTAVRPRSYFDFFVKSLSLPPGKLYSYLIPYTYTKSYGDRAILVGDACGQNKPLTGGGIMYSLTAANHAIALVNDAIMEEKFSSSFLSFYEKYWRKDLAREISRQYLLRKVYRKMTNNEIDYAAEKFGPLVAKMNGFDYDRLGETWNGISRLQLAKFLLPKAIRAM